MRRKQIYLRALVVLISALFACGCSSLSTRTGFYEPIVEDLRAGEYDSAVVQIELAREKNKYAEKDRFLYYFDLGLAHHYAGNYELSNKWLSEAEHAAEELFTRSISRAAASLLLNDNILEYAGEDYEVLYTNLFKAINYLQLNRFDDAFVEIRRANLKLELLEMKYAEAADQIREKMRADSGAVDFDYDFEKVRFNNSAFARYLSMHLYAADGLYDDAELDYNLFREAYLTQPHVYEFDPPEISFTTDQGGLVSVVAMTGMAPVKEALNLRIRTDKDLDLVQVLYDDAENEAEYGHVYLPISEDYYFKFAIPQIVYRPGRVSQIVVLADGEKIGRLQLLEDVGSVARETFEAKKSIIYFRSLARAIVKGLAAHELKEKADTGGLEGWLKKAAIDIGTDLIENADLRGSRLLPGEIYAGDFSIAEGEYDLKINFLDHDGNLIAQKRIHDYRIDAGRLCLINAVCLK